MAAKTVIPQSSRHCNFAPIIPRHGVVTLFGYGVNVHVDRGHLTMHDGIAANRREGRLPRVGHGLRRLVMIGSDGLVSLSALRWLADQNAAFVMLDRDGSVLVTTGPVHPSDVRLRRAQSLAPDTGVAMKIAIELIRQKLVGQERLVRDQFQNAVSSETICNQRHALMKAASKEEIRRCEAHAALAYWKAWHELPVGFQHGDSRRVPEHWRTFGSRMSPLTRSPRLAVNPPNAMLNYLYAVLESEARLALSELGLDPGIGFLHSDTRTRDSLACDLMEPIRPQVDAYLLDWLRRAPLSRKWFFEEKDGNCRLTSQCAATLSETSRIWRQALGPLAEWICRTLWSTTSRPKSETPPATRLTQNRKREVKGILTKVPSTPRLRQLGQPADRIVQPLHSLTTLKLARLDRFDPITLSRIAASRRRQSTAQRMWSPNALPEQLNAKFYREQIQPRLVSVQARSIELALSVSGPYAWKIRKGCCIPHPRHWVSLAELVRLKIR
jgi:CRISPR-associated endonuclease Cas1